MNHHSPFDVVGIKLRNRSSFLIGMAILKFRWLAQMKGSMHSLLTQRPCDVMKGIKTAQAARMDCIIIYNFWIVST